MNLGAIDIGSNAARVLIMEVKKGPKGIEYNKLKLLRYPIRLGFDAFLKGKIGKEKSEKMIKMLKVFQLLMELYDVEDYTAYATSAMRHSANGKDLIKQIRKETGLNIEIINGQKEATMLYQTHFQHAMNPDRNYIYVDVGGGSTEITIFRNLKLVESRSFKIGTIRLLHNLNKPDDLNEMKEWVREHTNNRKYWGIGSGGNINTLFSNSGKSKGKPITLNYIETKLREYKRLTVKERMNTYGFKQDRADVIVPALTIYKTVFSAAEVKKIFVPKIGLADGMIQVLSQKHLTE